MAQKLNPLQMVAREVAEHSGHEEETVELAMTELLEHLQLRAVNEIDTDPDSAAAAAAAIQYRIICEMIAMFGTQLIAFEDMEEDLARGDPN